MVTPITVFRCDRLSIRLSVESCVRNYRKVGKRKRAGGVIDSTLTTRASVDKCKGCPIGEAHARGEPTPPELLTQIVPKGDPRRWPKEERPPVNSQYWYGELRWMNRT